LFCARRYLQVDCGARSHRLESLNLPHPTRHLATSAPHVPTDLSLQALVAVMRKLLHAIWGMLKTDTDFDGAKFRKLPEAA